MSYRSMENLIRGIMAESHAPALKIPEPERVKDALTLLHSQGITSAAKKDENTITIGAKDAALAADIMSRAIQNGKLQAAPQMVSDNAVDVPEPTVEPVAVKAEPHPPEGGQAFGEEVKVDDETEQNNGSVDAEGKVELEPRSLNNRMQNKTKKIDEDVEQIDELSRETLHKVANVARKKNRPDVLKAAIKAGKRTKDQPTYKFAEQTETPEVEQINELSYAKLKAYTTAGKAALKNEASSDRLSKKIAKRQEYLHKATAKKVKIVSKAAFGEQKNGTDTILRILAEGSSKPRLMATHMSPCGKHCAKVYSRNEFGEHTVKHFYNGKHHEPADYHTSDLEDAHGTARSEMKRASQLPLKEAAEDGTTPFQLSEALLVEYESGVKKVGTYHDKTGGTITMHQSRNDPKHHFLVHKGQVRDYHHGSAEEFHKKITSGPHKLVGALHEEAEQLDELGSGTLTRYAIKAAASKRHHIAATAGSLARGNAVKGEPETRRAYHAAAAKHQLKVANRDTGIHNATHKIAKKAKNPVLEEVITEGKKDDVEKAKKHLFKLPIANELGKTIHTATSHFNYVQDACDHVYNNHHRELGFEDYDKIKPHLVAHFKEHGLKD